MTLATRTPDDLETLLEDVFVTHDRELLSELFQQEAVLVLHGRSAPDREARGRPEIVALIAGMWQRGETYLADPRRIVQAGETALVVGATGIGVLKRGSDRAWRYAIALLSREYPGAPPAEERPA